MDAPGVTGAVEILDTESAAGDQFLPPVSVEDSGEPTLARDGDAVGCLREDLRRLAEQVAAIDRRDAAQHGGLKGEIAHLVRRVARLEALPKARPTR